MVEQARLEQRALRDDIIEIEAGIPGPQEKLPVVKEYLRIVLSRFWLALAIFFVCLVGSIIFLATRTPMYQATRRVLIQPKLPRTLPEIEQVYEQIGVGGGSTESFLRTQYQLLLSPAVLESTLDDPALNLSGLPQFQQNDRLGQFAKYFSVSPVKRTWLVDVSFIWPDKNQAAQVVNKLVDYYIDEHSHRRLGLTRDSLDVLKLELRKLRPTAEKAVRLEHEFMKRHQMASLDKDQDIKVQKYQDINRKVTELGSARSRWESRMTSIQKNLAMEEAAAYLPEVINSETMRELKLSMVKTQQEHSDLLGRLGPKHDAVITAENKIKAIEAKMKSEALAILAASQSELERILQQEKDHQQVLTTLDAEMIEYSRIKAEYSQLHEDAEDKKEMAKKVQNRIKEIELSLATGVKEKNIFPQGVASVPNAKHSPRTTVHIAAGVFIGLVLAIGTCFLLDSLDTTVKTKEDVEQLFALPVLGYVPSLDDVGRGEKKNGQTNRTRDFAAMEEPHSILAESFRSIRTSLSLSGNGQDGTKLIAVTSSSPSEGKSIVSINLALALARAGKKVLLVDADMRKPRLHKSFAVNPHPGLSNLLAGQRDVPLKLAIRATDIANLSLLPSGPIPPNPAELLDSPLLGQLLGSLPAEFDYVIFDTPPAGNVTDAVILATRVHRTILVVRSFKAQKNVLGRTAQMLQLAQRKPSSVILNNADVPRGSYGYYDSYGHYQSRYYYYGQDDDKKRRRKKKRRKDHQVIPAPNAEKSTICALEEVGAEA